MENLDTKEKGIAVDLVGLRALVETALDGRILVVELEKTDETRE